MFQSTKSLFCNKSNKNFRLEKLKILLKTENKILKKIFLFILAILLFFSGCTRLPARLTYFIKEGSTIEKKFDEDYLSEKFQLYLNKITGVELKENNRVKILKNGTTVIDSMYDLIEKSEHYVLLEEYIFRYDEVGKKFIDLLKKKSKEGIKIYVIIDNIGTCKNSMKIFCELKNAGVNMLLHNPLVNWTILRIDYRNHRKVLVVDGKKGIISGSGLGKEYRYWRDLGIYIEGSAIKDLEDSFWISWKDAGWGFINKNLSLPILADVKEKFDDLVFPFKREINSYVDTDCAGKTKVRIVSTYPFMNHYELFEDYIEVINNAKKYIYITNAYFVPNVYVRNALKAAVKRGVNVKIILPGKTDLPIIRRASRMFFENLLKNGIELYELKGPVLHAKYMLIDDIYASIGSTNFLDRAFFMNFECNADVFDKDIACELKEIFFDDISKSKKIIYENWKKRSLLDKIKERLHITTLTLF